MIEKIPPDLKLSIIMMVEKAIKDFKSYPTKKELWKGLPKQIQYQTFKRILEYLEGSDKILYDGKSIIWVAADNPKLKKLLDESIRVR